MPEKSANTIFSLQPIIDECATIIYWKDSNGMILGCNKAHAEFFGYKTPEEVIGKKSIDFVSEEEAKNVDRIDQEIIAGKETVTTEEIITTPDGITKVVSNRKSPVFDSEGKPAGIIGTVTDITAQKEADTIRDNFISNIEHDIRTPFSGLYGMSRILVDMEQDAEKKELLGMICESAKTLLDYCNNIIEFSIQNDEELPIIEKVIDLRSISDEIIRMHAVAAKHEQLELTTQYSDNIPNMLMGDPHRIKSILINLLSNALKFTEKGGSICLSISVQTLHIEKRYCAVRLSVKDTGVGISEDKFDFIFQKFARGTLSNKGRYPGLGLGLTNVKKFVEDLDGEIQLTSTMGKGSEFSIIIPMKISFSDNILANDNN